MFRIFLFIVLHLILINFLPLSFTYVLTANAVYLGAFLAFIYRKRNDELETTYNIARYRLRVKDRMESTFEGNYASRKKKKKTIDDVTRGMWIGSFFSDGGIIGTLAKTAGVGAKKYYDSLNREDKKKYNRIKRDIKSAEEDLKLIDREFKVLFGLSTAYIIGISIYLFNDHIIYLLE